jgi:hypothetical protein
MRKALFALVVAFCALFLTGSAQAEEPGCYKCNVYIVTTQTPGGGTSFSMQGGCARSDEGAWGHTDCHTQYEDQYTVNCDETGMLCMWVSVSPDEGCGCGR